MIYVYECLKCGHNFEIIKSVSHIDDIETCPKCESVENKRIICGGCGFINANDWDTAHYSIALGKVVKSNAEERSKAKALGYEELGNTDPVKLENEYSRERQKQIDDNYKKSKNEAIKYIKGY